MEITYDENGNEITLGFHEYKIIRGAKSANYHKTLKKIRENNQKKKNLLKNKYHYNNQLDGLRSRWEARRLEREIKEVEEAAQRMDLAPAWNLLERIQKWQSSKKKGKGKNKKKKLQ